VRCVVFFLLVFFVWFFFFFFFCFLVCCVLPFLPSWSIPPSPLALSACRQKVQKVLTWTEGMSACRPWKVPPSWSPSPLYGDGVGLFRWKSAAGWPRWMSPKEGALSPSTWTANRYNRFFCNASRQPQLARPILDTPMMPLDADPSALEDKRKTKKNPYPSIARNITRTSDLAGQGGNPSTECFTRRGFFRGKIHVSGAGEEYLYCSA